MVIPEETRDSEPIVRVLSEARLLKVKAPSRVSKSGAMSSVSPDTPSAINEPLISSTLLSVIAPFTEEETVMLPSKVSQLVRLSASPWLEMVTLLEPGWYEQESWYDVKEEVPHRHPKPQELFAM
jgi:hypothetical protein